MDPLSVTASIIAVLQLSAKVLEYLSNVKDASKDHAQCAMETSNLYNLLTNLRFQLEDGGSDKLWYIAVRALAVENGPLDQFKQTLELLQANITKGGKALMWKFYKEEITGILGRMERLKTLVAIVLQMDHFKLSQAIKDDTNIIRTHIPILQSQIHMIRQNQNDAQHGKNMTWLSPTDYPAQQSDFISRREEGTEYTILYRNPWCRKTMIAAIAVDHLLKEVHSSTIGVAYVYCNYKAQREQDVTSLLAAILKQLVQARPSIAEPVERLHKKHANPGTRPSLKEIFDALRDIVTEYSTIHIVIDALDECRDSDGTRRQLLAKLRELQTGGDFRIMATSRDLPEVVNEFSEALRLEVQASNEDVKRFVAGQIIRLPNCIRRDSALLDMVEDRIVEAVDGMFLLARLHTDSLLDKRTPKQVKLTLAKMQKGSAALDDAYRDAFQRIEHQPSGDYEQAKKVLSWITYAKRPLTTTEICCALAVEPEEAELDPENMPDIEDLVSVCAGLVVIDPETNIIRLVHYTTQEYFERIRDTWNPGSQLDIASTCITYLSFNAFKTGSCSTAQELRERLQQNVFLDYAATHWGNHSRDVESEVCDLACSFLLDDGLRLCAAQVKWAWIRPLTGWSLKNYVRIPANTALHCTAKFGLSKIALELLLRFKEGSGTALNTIDEKGKTPLYVASTHGNNEIVKLLLDKGANVNAKGRSSTALYGASDNGHEEVVKLLLDKGANVNAEGPFGTALDGASGNGHEEVVKLLLNKGANVGIRDALKSALNGDHKQVVKLLLDMDEGGHSSVSSIATP